MTAITTLERRFRFGVTTLADPDPKAEPLAAMRMHAGAYPFLSAATLGEPAVEGDLLVYPVVKPTVQTKGADKGRRTKAPSALDEILAWGADAHTVDADQPARWAAVAAMTNARADAKANPLVDSLLIPMA